MVLGGGSAGGGYSGGHGRPGVSKTTVVAIAVIGVGFFFAFSYTAGWWPRDPEPLAQVKEEAAVAPSTWGDRLERVATAGILIGGVAALVIATWRGLSADQQAKVAKEQAETALTQTAGSQRRLLDERYQAGAAMLESPVLVVRLAGIHALDRLVEDDKQRYYADVMNLLAVFVRFPVSAKTEIVDGVLRDDLQAALGAISRRNDPQDFKRLPKAALTNRAILLHEGGPVNLRNAKLRNSFILHGNLRNVMFVGADLSNCEAWNTDFSGSNFLRATLRDGSFIGCDLSGAEFVVADLTGRMMAGSTLDSANLRSANLSGVEFSDDGRNPVIGLTQEQLDEAKANPYDPPMLEGVLDAETGRSLAWRGKPWFGPR